jgi:hypothetical protein
VDVAALAAVAGDCPDGILPDINLPGRDGFAVAAAIAATYPAVRIVLTSSDTEHVPGAPLKTRGATAFVPGQCGHGRAASPARGSWSVGYWGSSAWQPPAGIQAQRGAEHRIDAVDERDPTRPAQFVGLYPPARDREADVLRQGHASG